MRQTFKVYVVGDGEDSDQTCVSDLPWNTGHVFIPWTAVEKDTEHDTISIKFSELGA
jgi:hypothetical protein